MEYKELLNDIVDQLVDSNSLNLVYHQPQFDKKMPSKNRLEEMLELMKSLLFPGYYGNSLIEPDTLEYHTGVNIDRLYKLSKEQINRGLCFECQNGQDVKCKICSQKAGGIALEFIQKLPLIRTMLAKDVEATFLADPASKSYGEIIFAYPGIRFTCTITGAA